MPEIRNNSNTGPGAGALCDSPRSSKELNIVVMECYYRSNPTDENGVPLKGYRQRMYKEWLQRGPFRDTTEQRICYQARAIRKNGWLTEIELEMIKRRINTTGPHETEQEGNQGVEDDSFPDSDEPFVTAELSISINEASEEQVIVVNEIK